MATRAAQRVGQVAGLLARHLRSGLPQDAAGLETIRLSLGAPGVDEALAVLAADPESSEHAPLRALLFFPGPETLRELEPALAEAGLDEAGARVLERETVRLAAGRATLLLPDGTRPTLAAAEAELAGFVRRLRPAATAPAELRALPLRRFPAGEHGALAVDLCVALRHSRLAWTPAQTFFLAALLERAGAGELPGLCAWALGFLDLCGGEFSPRQALAARRRALATQLRQAEAQERSLAAGSYEQRLSQGQRPGHLHAPDLRAELEWLDRACRLVLGVDGEALTEVSVLDLGQAEDAQGLLRLLGQAGG